MFVRRSFVQQAASVSFTTRGTESSARHVVGMNVCGMNVRCAVETTGMMCRHRSTCHRPVIGQVSGKTLSPVIFFFLSHSFCLAVSFAVARQIDSRHWHFNVSGFTIRSGLEPADNAVMEEQAPGASPTPSNLSCGHHLLLGLDSAVPFCSELITAGSQLDDQD